MSSLVKKCVNKQLLWKSGKNLNMYEYFHELSTILIIQINFNLKFRTLERILGTKMWSQGTTLSSIYA